MRFRCDTMDLAGEALQDLGRFFKVCRLFTSMAPTPLLMFVLEQRRTSSIMGDSEIDF